MEPYTLAIVGIIVLFLLMFLRLPISFAMFITGFVGLYFASSMSAAVNVLSADLWNQFSSYSLSIIPLYILMGEIVYRAGITSKLFDAAYKWIGHFKGGMASTTVLASAGFAMICGSNSATAATMATMSLPELKKYNYDKRLSTGAVATGGTLGIIIPPSTVLIVLALQMQISVKDLFIASIIPGVLLTVMLLMTVFLICNINPGMGPAGAKASWKERILSTVEVIPIFLLFVFVIGGLYLGWFTPTESGAFGAFGAIVITVIMRRLTFAKFIEAVGAALKSSAMVFMLVVGAFIFGRFLTITRLPYGIAEYVNDLALPAVIIIALIVVVYVIGGSLMDALGFLLISVSIFYPTVTMLGYDPVWFAILLTIVTSMGAITPPVGVNVFIVQGLSKDATLSDVFKGSAYFLIPYVIFIALIIAFPAIITFVL